MIATLNEEDTRKAHRRCLGCGRTFWTDRCHRFCPTCARRNEMNPGPRALPVRLLLDPRHHSEDE